MNILIIVVCFLFVIMLVPYYLIIAKPLKNEEALKKEEQKRLAKAHRSSTEISGKGSTQNDQQPPNKDWIEFYEGGF